MSRCAAQNIQTSNSENVSSFSLVLYVYRTLDVQNRMFPYWSMKEFRKVEWLKKTLAKVVDFVPLGALSGPGAPDPDLGRFQIRA